METERKFLVVGDFRREVYASSRIVQGYLCLSPGRTVRVRIRDDKGFLTVKGAAAPGRLSRFEWEREIPLDEARGMLALADGGCIDKTRHLIRNADGRHIWEVDEFHGDNEGLIVAEIELSDENESFDKPAWVGGEVSFDRRYANSQLIVNPYRNWK